MSGSDWRPRVADTSFLFAFFDERDVHHRDARLAMQRPGPVVLPGEVITEFLGLAAVRFDRAMSRQALRALCRLPQVDPTHETDVRAALHIMDDIGLSFVDAVVLWHCRRLQAPAETFDARLEQLARPAQ